MLVYLAKILNVHCRQISIKMYFLQKFVSHKLTCRPPDTSTHCFNASKNSPPKVQSSPLAPLPPSPFIPNPYFHFFNNYLPYYYFSGFSFDLFMNKHGVHNKLWHLNSPSSLLRMIILRFKPVI